MLTAMSCGVAGVDTHMKAMGVTGNNISNVNTYGFKSSSAAFTDVMYQTLSGASAPGAANGGKDPVQMGYGAKIGAISVNTGKGDEASTGSQKDCYIDGEGYFILADQATPGAKATDQPTVNSYKYTRVGSMKFDEAGNLVDSATGNYVCGLSAATTGDLPTTAPTYTASNTPGIIHYDTTDANNTLSEISFAADGTITAKNSAGKVVSVGKLELAHFTNPAGLSQQGNSCVGKTDNSGDAKCDFPGSGATGPLVTGALEASNVDLATELSNMIVYERGLQANSKIISVSDEMLETLVNMKR